MDDLPMGGLDDCDCRDQSGADPVSSERILVPESAPTPAPTFRPLKITSEVQTTFVRPKKPRSKGTGSHCVVSHKGKIVHCYHDPGVAKRVAKSFGDRTGTKFTVKDR